MRLRALSQRGFHDVSVDEIADFAGVSKGCFYTHYKSKQEIVLAACGYYYRSYQQRIQGEIAKLTDPLRRLRRALELTVKNCVLDEKNRVFTTELFALALQDPVVRATWAQFYDSVRELFVGLVAAADASREIRVAQPRKAVDLVLSTIEGVKLRAAFEPHLGGREHQKEIVDGLMAYLDSAPRQSKPSETKHSSAGRSRRTTPVH